VAAASPLAQPHGDQTFTYIQAEQLEYRAATDGSDTFSWDVRGWVGGDYNRLWFKTQGDDRIDGPVENGEVQLRYSRLIGPFWDLAVGVRYDVQPDPSRAYAVFALHGLAPYVDEVDADMFVSEEGDVSARLEVEYSILLTQRLILQPSSELDFAVQEVKEFRAPGSARLSWVYGSATRSIASSRPTSASFGNGKLAGQPISREAKERRLTRQPS